LFRVALLACSAHGVVLIVYRRGRSLIDSDTIDTVPVARLGKETLFVPRCLLVADQSMRRSDTRTVTCVVTPEGKSLAD